VLTCSADVSRISNLNGQYIPQNSDQVFSLVRPAADKVPWWSLLTGLPLHGFYFWADKQFMVQRVLGAKNLDLRRWGALLASLRTLPVIFTRVVPGVLGQSFQYFGYQQPELCCGRAIYRWIVLEAGQGDWRCRESAYRLFPGHDFADSDSHCSRKSLVGGSP
jgi:hypothetical protein